MIRLILCSVIALCPVAANAQALSSTRATSPGVVLPLTLDEVLRSSARSAPQIVEALARVRQAEGRSLSAEGAFDTVFDVDG